MVEQTVSSLEESVNIANELIPFGSIIPLFHTEEDGLSPYPGLVVGHIFATNKEKKDLEVMEALMPIVFHGMKRYVCSLDEDAGELTAWAAESLDLYDEKTYNTDEWTVVFH